MNTPWSQLPAGFPARHDGRRLTVHEKLLRTALVGATGLLLVATPVAALVLPGVPAASEVSVPELSAPTSVAPETRSTVPLTLSPRTSAPATSQPRTSAPRTTPPRTAEAPEPEPEPEPDRPRPRPPRITIPLLPDIDLPRRPGDGRPDPDRPPFGDRCAEILGDRFCDD